STTTVFDLHPRCFQIFTELTGVCMSSQSPRLSPFACDRAPTAGSAQAAPLNPQPAAPATSSTERRWLCLMERFSRRMLHSSLAGLQFGQLVLEHEQSSERFGDLSRCALSGHVRLNSPRFYRRLLSDGLLGAAESYRGKPSRYTTRLPR
ncbi:MAG: hypothetical protein ACKO3T_13900, partial [Planctomycetaceae bacterium]